MKVEHFYWDSCIFYCLLTGQQPFYQADVLELLEDAKKGRAKIYTSTIALAEIKPSALKQRGHANIQKFFDTLQGAVNLLDPNPNIMMAAGALRGCDPTNPSDVKTPNKRAIGLGDSIHLQTCLYIRDVLGVTDIVFQTFDDGKGKGWEGKCVPLLTFERWFPDPKSKPIADVCSLKRTLPRAVQTNLFNQGITFTGVTSSPPPGPGPATNN